MLKPNVDKAEFLKDYWQKKPILIKNFFSNFENYTNPEELLEIACIDTVDSRIVTTRPEYCVAERYSLAQGPFDSDCLPALTEKNWSLLVQSAELWIPDLREMIRAFGFLPRWRIEDIMVSFATQGGGVGPHFDQYDVFLVQGLGQRTWCVGERIDLTASHQSPADTASDLNLIDEFIVNQNFTVTSGDVLYVPPGYTHWGISQSPSLCYSVGFRAPSNAEMIESFSNRVMELLTESQRLTDHTTPAMRDSAEITTKDWQHAWEVVAGLLANKGAFLQAFGSLVTEAKSPEFIEPLAGEVHIDELLAFRGPAVELVRNPASRFAYTVQTDSDLVLLFVDGESYELNRTCLSAVRTLCADELENIFNVSDLWQTDESRSLICRLVQSGALWLAEKED